ncbi:MAG: hypothetical protein E5W99_15355, partial [Mesorhizobium sp.]
MAPKDFFDALGSRQPINHLGKDRGLKVRQMLDKAARHAPLEPTLEERCQDERHTLRFTVRFASLVALPVRAVDGFSKNLAVFDVDDEAHSFVLLLNQMSGLPQSGQNQQLRKGILLLLRWRLSDPVKDGSNHITSAAIAAKDAKDGIADVTMLDQRLGTNVYRVDHLEDKRQVRVADQR